MISNAQSFRRQLTTILELKETHLAPLTSGFGRSTSTSTVKAEEEHTPQESPNLSAMPSNQSVTSANGIGKSLLSTRASATDNRQLPPKP